MDTIPIDVLYRIVLNDLSKEDIERFGEASDYFRTRVCDPASPHIRKDRFDALWMNLLHRDFSEHYSMESIEKSPREVYLDNSSRYTGDLKKDAANAAIAWDEKYLDMCLSKLGKEVTLPFLQKIAKGLLTKRESVLEVLKKHGYVPPAPGAGRCPAVLVRGQLCARIPVNGQDRCWQHAIQAAQH